MGVKGLWELVDSVKQELYTPSPGEGKTLAVDASIWMYQFLKVKRNISGETSSGHGTGLGGDGELWKGAVESGFFRRIMKLLMMGVKPIFVFDGKSPDAKILVINERRRRRKLNEDNVEKTAQSLIKKRLLMTALDETSSPSTSQPPIPTLSPVEKDGFALPPKPDINLTRLDPRLATTADHLRFARQNQLSDMELSLADTDMEEFTSLPLEQQHDILVELKLRSRTPNVTRLIGMLERSSGDPEAFSREQIANLIQRKIISDRVSKHNMKQLDSEGKQIIQPARIVSERNREFFFVRNAQEAGGLPGGVSMTTASSSFSGTSSKLQIKVVEHEAVMTRSLPPIGSFAPRLFSDAVDTTTVKDSLSLEALLSETVHVVDDAEDEEIHLDTASDELLPFFPVAAPSLPQKESPSSSEDTNDTESISSEVVELITPPLPENEAIDNNVLAMHYISLAPQSTQDLFQPIERHIFNIVQEPNLVELLLQMDELEAQIAQCTRFSDSWYGYSWFLKFIEQIHFRRTAEDLVQQEKRREIKKKLLDRPSDSGWLSSRDTKSGLRFKSDIQFEPPPALDEITMADTDRPFISMDEIDYSEDEDFQKAIQLSLATSKASETPHPLRAIVPNPATPPPQVENVTFTSLLALQDPSLRPPQPFFDVNNPATDSREDELEFSFPKRRFPVKSNVTEVTSSILLDDDKDNDIPLFTPSPVLTPTTDKATFNAPSTKVIAPEVVGDSDEEDDVLWEAVSPIVPLSSPSYSLTRGIVPLEKYRGKDDTEDCNDIDGRPMDPVDLVVSDDQDSISVSNPVCITDDEEENAVDVEDRIDIEAPDLAQEDEELVRMLREIQGGAGSSALFRQKMQADLNSLSATYLSQKRDADGITSDMIENIQLLLQNFGIPWIQAPSEAEAQCAYLYTARLVDGIITDDSDTFLFDGSSIYRHFFSPGKSVELYDVARLCKELRLCRLSLIALAYLTGSDYSPGVHGIGPKRAIKHLEMYGLLLPLASADTDEDVEVLDEPEMTPIDQLLGDDAEGYLMDALTRFREDHEANGPATTSGSKKRKKSAGTLSFPPGFPDPRIFRAYFYPDIDTRRQGLFSQGVIQLNGIRDLMSRYAGWSQTKTDAALLPLQKWMSDRESRIKQTKLDSFFSISSFVASNNPNAPTDTPPMSKGKKGAAKGKARIAPSKGRKATTPKKDSKHVTTIIDDDNDTVDDEE